MDTYRSNGTNGDAGSPVSSNQNGMSRNGAPDKPERKINAKEAISKHRNWFSNFEKSKSPSTSAGPESVDSARRTSVNKENKPSYVAAAGGLSASKAAVLRYCPSSSSLSSLVSSFSSFSNLSTVSFI